MILKHPTLVGIRILAWPLTILLALYPTFYKITFVPSDKIVGIEIEVDGNDDVNPYFSWDFIPVDEGVSTIEVSRHNVLPKGSYVITASTEMWSDGQLIPVEHTSVIIHIP